VTCLAFILSRMIRCFLSFSVSAAFRFSESSVKAGEYTTFGFDIELTRAADALPADYGSFPAAIGIVLDHYGVSGFELKVVRGRLPGLEGFSGAYLTASFSDSETDVAWERLTSALRVLAGPLNLDSLVSSRVIQPVDLPEGSRAMHIPYQRMCTENLAALLILLPCKADSGLASSLYQRLNDFSGLPLMIQLTASSAEGKLRLRLGITSTLDQSKLPSPKGACPAALTVEAPAWKSVASGLSVSKKYAEVGSGDGLLSFTASNPRGVDRVEIIERLPFFLTPLVASFRVSKPTCQVSYDHQPCGDVHGGTCLSFILSSDEPSCSFSFHVLKEYVPIRQFTFAIEKGLDISGVFFRESGSGWRVSNGVLVHVAMVDGSMSYNTLALCLAAMTLVYGSIGRALFVETTGVSFLARIAGFFGKTKRD